MSNESQSLNTTDLVAWVDELRAGRPNAAEPTFRKIMARVEQLAGSMFAKFGRVGRFVDIDDVVQNTLIRLLAAFRDIRPTSRQHFYALANTLIRRELLDLAKRYYGPRGHGTNLADAGVGDGTGEHAPVAADPAAELSLAAAFHEGIERLPPQEREVVSLTYYHGWSQREIADLFQVTVRTVQRWLDAAFAKLRDGHLGE